MAQSHLHAEKGHQTQTKEEVVPQKERNKASKKAT
jgi:hypothetical protein